MDKIVHKLEGFKTDVFYQVHNLGNKTDASGINWANYNYLYHCAHCKKKGKVFVSIELGTLPSANKRFSPYWQMGGLKTITEYEKSCPNCNAEWKQGQSEKWSRSVQKITFDNGDIMYLYQTIHPRWSNAQPIICQYKLRIKKDTGKMSLTVNGKTIYDVYTTSKMLQIYRKYFEDAPTEAEYYISRNHRLKDILQYIGEGRPDRFFTYIYGNLRRRLYYAYDKHGMKAAYRTVLSNKGNKYLYKLAWQKPEFICILNELISLVGADPLANIVKHIPESKIHSETLNKLKHMFNLGLSTTKVFNITNTGELYSVSRWAVHDSARMYHTLLSRTNSEYKLPKYRDLDELHELLVRDINQVEDVAAKEIMLPLTNLEEYHASEYSVKVANTAHDLNLLGRVLNICVAGYRDTVLGGDRVIAYVTKGNHMVACLEVIPNTSSLVQAKLARNNSVSKDEEIERVVYSWLKKNRLKSSTYDVSFKITEDVTKKIELEYRHAMRKVLNEHALDLYPPVIPQLDEDFPF